VARYGTPQMARTVEVAEKIRLGFAPPHKRALLDVRHQQKLAGLGYRRLRYFAYQTHHYSKVRGQHRLYQEDGTEVKVPTEV
jgi:hypothetical protein